MFALRRTTISATVGSTGRKSSLSSLVSVTAPDETRSEQYEDRKNVFQTLFTTRSFFAVPSPPQSSVDVLSIATATAANQWSYCWKSNFSSTTAPAFSLLDQLQQPMLLETLYRKGIYLISTLKRRRKMMNKHKLRKRRKKNRMKNKK